MQGVQFGRPLEVRVHKVVRIVMTGGFLGAGKTTALGALARRLLRDGKRVGFVTNDQAANLVDTAILRELSLPIAEVAGGCFCCRFSQLVEATQTVLDQDPDVLLCEPVGSCTDMAATVLTPLKYFYPDAFSVAPFAVLADPERVREAVLGEMKGRFPEEVSYIFRKQLEEGDVIVLNKVDTLTSADAERIADSLRSLYAKPVYRLSAITGEGLEEWLDEMMGDHPSGGNILQEIDYDTYARGEAVLGWLNATATVRGCPEFDGEALVRALMTTLRDTCRAADAEIAHLKTTLAHDGCVVRANLTRTEQEPYVLAAQHSPMHEATLTLNARIHVDPGVLGGAAVTAINQAASAAGADAEITALQSFSPAYPRPPYRMTSAS